ncbi:MAG: M14 family metallopeptidase [Acidobacteriota bacterium]|nr:M14 family metallopeptidase [Acidobacteriota bacterium]
MSRRKSSLAIAMAICLGFVLSPAAKTPARTDPEQTGTAVIGIPLRPGLAGSLRSLRLDPLAVWKGALYVRAGEGDRRRLRAAGLASFEPRDIFRAVPRTASEAEGGPNGAYHSYSELETEMTGLQSKYPELAKLTSIGLSLENRRLLALKISDHPGLEEDEAGILLVGGHHAREWISVEVPLQIAASLLEGYDSDPSIRDLVNGSEIWVVPMLNPDGLEYSIWSYRYWRKNRRANADGSFGVDLNRNYDCQWGIDDVGSSPDPESEVFRGPEAFSEPEPKALRDFVLRQGFSAAVFYHSYSQLILYPWSWTSEPAPKRLEFEALAGKLSELIAAVSGRIYAAGQSGEDLYTSNGDAADWVYAGLDVPALTIELPPVDLVNGGFLNAEADIASISGENMPAVQELIRSAIRGYASGSRGHGATVVIRAAGRTPARIR